MNDKQRQYSMDLTLALSSRNPSIAQKALIEKAKERTPNLFSWSKKMASTVRKRVDSYMLDTWKETIKEESTESEHEIFYDTDQVGGWIYTK